MVSCCLCGTSRTETNKKLVTFHEFPREAHRRSEWIRFVNKPNWQPSQTSLLCSKHFVEESFDHSSCPTVRLKKNAVPTLNVQRLKYVKTYNTEIVTAATSQQCAPRPVALIKPSYLLRLDSVSSSQDLPRILKIKHGKLVKEMSPSTSQTSQTKVKTFNPKIVEVTSASSQQWTPKHVSQLRSSESDTASYILGINSETAAEDTSPTTLETSENKRPLEEPAQLLPNTDLRNKLESVLKSEQLKTLRIRKLQRENCRLRHKVVHLRSVIQKLQQKNVFEKKLCEVMTDIFGKNKKIK